MQRIMNDIKKEWMKQVEESVAAIDMKKVSAFISSFKVVLDKVQNWEFGGNLNMLHMSPLPGPQMTEMKAVEH